VPIGTISESVTGEREVEKENESAKGREERGEGEEKISSVAQYML